MKYEQGFERLLVEIDRLRSELGNLTRLSLHQRQAQGLRESTNPLNSFGGKVFSQADEDGITLEIVRRVFGDTPKYFWEFGVGDGTENNTLVLLAKGWSGEWFGNETLAFDPGLLESGPLRYRKGWLSRESFRSLLESQNTLSSSPDLISLDLDGNEYHFVRAILDDGLRPALFVVEYNAKFLPGLEWVMAYDSEHKWQGDDYFGASLTSFSKLLKSFGYRLICCNAATGANAFFIDEAYSSLFDDVPTEEAKIYMPPNYLLPGPNGHPQSVRMIESLLVK